MLVISGASLASVTAMVNVAELVLVSALVAVIVTVHEFEASKFRFVLSATVTTPLDESTPNTSEQDCAVTAYVMLLVVPSSSDADAVTPVPVPAAEFSATVSPALLESVGVDTSNSSTSETEMLTVSVVAAVPSPTEIVKV